MARINEVDVIKQLDSIGRDIQKWLDKEKRKRPWLAEEMEISSVTLLEKMKDDSKWKKSELQSLGKIKILQIWE